MEREEIKGMLALSGKEWKCYTDSTKKEIRKLNPDLTDEEAEKVFILTGSLKTDIEEQPNNLNI